MVGRFLNADGAEINRPAVRFGNISLMPIPMNQEFNKLSKPSYCIDMHSRDGFSGSPVYVYRKPGQDLTSGNLDMGNQFLFLLGIHWAQFPEAWEGQLQAEEESKSEVSIAGGMQRVRVMGLSGMTCVAPASAILALLEHAKLRAFHEANNALAKRKKEEEEARNAKLEATSPASSDPASPSGDAPPSEPLTEGR